MADKVGWRGVRGVSCGRALGAGALLLGWLLWPANASGYCRTTTCDPHATDPNDACVLDGDSCPINGKPLFWSSSCVSLAVHERGSPLRGISYDVAHELAFEAFQRWLTVDCSGEPPSFELLDLSPAACAEGQYNTSDANANVLLFRDDDWPHDDPDATLALTIVTFNTKTGEIYDADIEVNSFRSELSVNGGPSGYDLPSILTHEAGHFLGFSHSWVAGSSMREGGWVGDTSMRTLAADDVRGMCALYPAHSTPKSSECQPRHGFSPECAANEVAGCGCQQGRLPKAPSVLLLSGLFGLMLWRRAHWRVAGRCHALG